MRARFSPSVLSAAASGRALPTLLVLRAYVAACGGDLAAWQARWEQLHGQLTATNPTLLSDEPEPPSPPDAPHPATAVPAASASATTSAAVVVDDQWGRMFEPLRKGDPARVGRYRLAARLGGGAMGEVFLASSPAGRPVAVKLVRGEYARDGMFRARFAKEVAAIRTVTAAHTPALLDADLEAERPWIATTYIPGPSLARVIELSGPLPAPVLRALAAGIAEALAAIHAAGIVHGDLKPSNILLDRDGPKVIDFGISRALDSTVLTSTGMLVGTAGYTAPELAARGETLPAGDVFALGCTLAYAATGIAPFGQGTDAQVLYRIVHHDPAPEALACADKQLRVLIEACLVKDPAQRPTPQAVIEACGTTPEGEDSWLPSALAAQAVAHGRDAAEQLARAARRRASRQVKIGLAPLLLVLAIVTVAALTTNRSPSTDLQTLGPSHPATTTLTTAPISPSRSASPSPTPSASPTSTGRMTEPEMLTALEQLLPAGVSLSNILYNFGTDSSDIDADYNDGQGKAGLSVWVSPGPGGAASCSAQDTDAGGIRPSGAWPFGCTSRTPEAGGRELVFVDAAEFGGWYDVTIEYNRPDGTFIMINVNNGPIDPQPSPDRAAPAGTLADWEAIAESPDWHT